MHGRIPLIVVDEVRWEVAVPQLQILPISISSQEMVGFNNKKLCTPTYDIHWWMPSVRHNLSQPKRLLVHPARLFLSPDAKLKHFKRLLEKEFHLLLVELVLKIRGRAVSCSISCLLFNPSCVRYDGGKWTATPNPTLLKTSVKNIVPSPYLLQLVRVLAQAWGWWWLVLV